MISSRVLALIGVVIAAAAFRFLPAPVNFSPIAAMALFAGFSFRHRAAAYAFPLVAMFLSDLVLGFHDTMWAVYLSFVLVTALGFFLRDSKGWAVKGTAAVASSMLFFVLTNFAVWLQGSMYPMTYEGLVSCYIAALPFLENSLAGDLTFTAVLFTGWALVEKTHPAFRKTVA